MKFPRRKFLQLAAGAAALPAVFRIARAQPSSEVASPKKGTRVITLGTVAGPPPRAHRAQSSNLLIVNGTLYVVDAGDGAARRIAKAGFDVREVGTVFITHHHDDHTAGLGTLMSVAWDNQRTQPINVYGPPRTEELVKAAVQYYGISAEIRIADGGRTIPISQLFFGHDVGTGIVQPPRSPACGGAGRRRSLVLHRLALGRARPGFLLPEKEVGIPAERVVAFYNKRGTCEQWIKEGKSAIRWTRLSCRTFAANAVRLQLHALAYNLGNFLRTLATPEPIKDWSLTSLKEKLIKIGAKVVSHGRYVAFQMAEVAIPRRMFQEILRLIAELRPQPPPAPA